MIEQVGVCVMATIFDDIGKGIKDGVSFIVEKTDELTQYGKINIDLLSLKRELEKLQQKLGERVFQLFQDHQENLIVQDQQVSQWIGEIHQLNTRIAERQDALEQVKKSAPAK
jgi:hypothetical protein